MSINPYSHKNDYFKYKEEYLAEITKVIESGQFIGGDSVTQLEDSLKNYIDINHAICVSSGTDALLIALMAIDIKSGDEIITTPFTWISTSEVIVLLGAKPVFVDICSKTFNINENKIEKAITDKTKAILPVSLFGMMCNLPRIMEIAEENNLYVIEDAAQSMGAIIDGKKSCSLAHISCSSFYPTKPLGGWGDGGVCFTNDKNLAHKLNCIRNHGCIQRHNHELIGLNCRMSSLIAAPLLIKLKYFEESLINRISIAERYNNELKDLDYIKLPENLTDRHVYAQYTILLDNQTIRDKFIKYMKDNNINICIFYPYPLYHQDCLKNFYNKCPITEDICNRCVSLTCYDGLLYEEQSYIIKKIKEFI